ALAGRFGIEITHHASRITAKREHPTMLAPFASKVSALLCFASLLAAPAVSSDGNNQTKSTSQKPVAASSATKSDDAALRARDDTLHRAAIVIDTHNDVTSPMVDDNFDLATSGIAADGSMKPRAD